ncbi:hypothetical protein DFH09DRAFT_1371199 [Mycena vulgaris]|nr:hypothetical protein DFH09DRAFT_1371199 [Mycena vulgaris]
MSTKIIKGLTIHKEGVTLKYEGSTTLTISPAIGTHTTISEGDTITVPPSDEDHEFSYKGSTVATLNNHKGGQQVVIKGGAYHEATGPFTVTVKLTH